MTIKAIWRTAYVFTLGTIIAVGISIAIVPDAAARFGGGYGGGRGMGSGWIGRRWFWWRQLRSQLVWRQFVVPSIGREQFLLSSAEWIEFLL